MAALVAGQHFHCLQAVRLDTGLQPVPHDWKQIDEETRLDKVLQQALVGTMLGSQSLQPGALGVVVVVHVHARMHLATLGKVFDEGLGLGGLAGLVVSPPVLEGPCAVGPLREQPEQEEEPGVGAPERVALIVEEDVTVIRCRQRDQSGSAFVVGRFIDHPVGGWFAFCKAAGAYLQHCLGGETCQPLGPQIRHTVSPFGQTGQARHSGVHEPSCLGRSDAGDKLQRIGLPPVRGTHVGKVAVGAVVALDRCGRDSGTDRLQRNGQLLTQPSPIRAYIGETDRFDPARPQPDVHALRRDAELSLDRLGIEAQLQDMSRLGLRASQLGVDGFVGELAVGQVDTQQEVGDATHSLVYERHLVHDVVPAGEYIRRPFDEGRERLGLSVPCGDGIHVARCHLVRGEAFLLVFQALGHEQSCELAQSTVRSLAGAAFDLMLQREEVRAIQPGSHLRGSQQPSRRSRHRHGSRGCHKWATRETVVSVTQRAASVRN